MFLAIDIGNTTVNIGYFRDHVLGGSFSISSVDMVTVEDAGALTAKFLKANAGGSSEVERVGICSVVPTLTETYYSLAEKYFGIKAKIMSADIDLGFRILYEDPSQLGTDRLANVVAARKLYGYPLLVVDMGTATKYEVIDKNGDYIGGLIAPGVWTSASALFDKTAQLFPVNVEPPEHLIGTNTGDALKSGIYNGVVGQLRYLLESLGKELGAKSIKVVATGGYAELFRANLDLFNVVDMGLTLKGLEIALNH